jgi:hypothetical protein
MSARMVIVLATVLAVLVTGCGQAGTPTPSEEITAATASVEMPPVEPPGPDGPAGPPESVIEDLVAYGEQHRDAFGGLYIDPPGGRSVVMLFTRDLEVHERAVNDLAPGTRVRQVRFTEDELRDLQDFLVGSLFGQDGVEFLSASVDVIGNKVEVSLKSDDPTLELRLETAHLGMLDASVFPIPGPWANVESGDGWRLIAVGDELTEAYTVRAATTPEEWDELWAAAVGVDGDRPAVDLDAEVVVSFGHGLSQSCAELRLDDVVIEGGVVFSVTSDPLAPRNCTSDLSAASVFVVALARDALPADGFTLQLDARSAECCGDLDELDVPLP